MKSVVTSDLCRGDRVAVLSVLPGDPEALGVVGCYGKFTGDGGAVYAVDVCFDDGDTVGFNLFPDGFWRKNKLGPTGAAFWIERRKETT